VCGNSSNLRFSLFGIKYSKSSEQRVTLLSFLFPPDFPVSGFLIPFDLERIPSMGYHFD